LFGAKCVFNRKKGPNSGKEDRCKKRLRTLLGGKTLISPKIGQIHQF